MKPSSRNSFFRRLLGHQRGSVTPLFLLSFTAILGTTMGGIDLVRYNVVQNRLQSSLDGATLSAGRNLQNRQMANMGDPESAEYQSWQDDAFGYFRSNMPANYLGNTIEPEDLKIEYSDVPLEGDGYTKGQFVSMQVEGTLPLISTGFLNVSSMKVRAENRAVRHTPADIELVMALDNTGSMSSGGKIGTLKTAAKDLTKILFDARDEAKDTDTPRDITIGLVPFADTVNVGNTDYTRKWLNGARPEQKEFLENESTGWAGCISEPLPVMADPPSTGPYWSRAEGRELPPEALTPTAKFMPLHLTYRHLRNTVDDLGLGKNARIINDPVNKPVTLYPPTTNQRYDRRVGAWVAPDEKNIVTRFAVNPDTCVAKRESLFLSNDRTAVNTAINQMAANGNTIIPIGLQWAWRMLHPDWLGAWGDPLRPRTAEPKALRKIVVLLTDGQNEPISDERTLGVGADASGNYRTAYKLGYYVKTGCNSNGENCTENPAEQFYTPNNSYSNESRVTNRSNSQGPINSLIMRNPMTTSPNNGNNAVDKSSIGWGNDNKMRAGSIDNYLTALCEKVKKPDNHIKIYTVTLGNIGSSIENRMNACSSGAGYYYNTRNSSDLPKVFQSIASAMVELRLTK